MVETIFLIIAALFLKHFILDFPLQTPYQLQNKGTYGHLGGITHAGMHGIGTFLCFVFFTPYALFYAWADFAIHYHVDWAKMKLNDMLDAKSPADAKFWWLFGLDQFIHALTYIFLTYMLVVRG